MIRDSAVLTIGHSTLPFGEFLRRLQQHEVTAVADVRSAPYSRFNPQFDRESLAAALKPERIAYVYLGRELGGRSSDRSCYEDGRIVYDRLARTTAFRKGVERVMRGAATHRIVLMCAEKEPLDCHRTLLVGQALHRQGTDVRHILADASLEPHGAAMDRLLGQHSLRPEENLFGRQQPREAWVADAIRLHTRRVGHALQRESATEVPNP